LTVAGGYTCEVGEHAGIDRADARTTADVLCHALASKGARPGVYDIRLGKLGGQLLLVVTERASGSERRLFLQGLEEVPVASERLVSALVENKPIEQTQNVDNVVSSESNVPRLKKVQSGAFLGITGMSALGVPGGASAGAELDLLYRLRSVELVGEIRAGGIGSTDTKMGYFSLGVGGRYYTSDADTAPFIGAGVMFGYFQANQTNTAANGSGLGGYGEIGLGFLRSSSVGGLVALHADFPAFPLKENNGNGPATTYAVPISISAGLAFH
jgi:hypothetical protein